MSEAGTGVLFSGKAVRTWGGPLGAAGTATLRRRRLSFEPSGRLFSEQDFEVPLSHITELGWRSFRSRLAVSTTQGTYTLQGAVVPRLAVALQAMGVPLEGEPQSLAEERVHGHLVLTCKASWVSGPLHIPGWLAVGASQVVFNASGVMEQLAGIEDVRFSLGELRAASAEGSSLLLTAEDAPFRLLTQDPGRVLVELSLAAVRHGLPQAVALPPPVLDPGDEVLQELDGVWYQPSVGRLVRGRAWVCSQSGLVFRGVDGSTDELPLEALQQSVFGRLSTDEADVLRVSMASGGAVLLRPRRGADALVELRDHVLSLPMAGAVDLGELGRLRRVQGEVTFARITSNHKDSLGFRSGFIVQAPDAIGLVIREDMDWDQPRGTRVELTIGMERGVYEINGRLLRRGEIPASQVGPGPGDGEPGAPRPSHLRVLFVSIPHADQVVFMKTRRADYRIPSLDGVAVRETRWLPGRGRVGWGKTLEGRLFDLSAAGCCVLLHQELAVGQVRELRFTIAGTLRTLVGEVVYRMRHTEDGMEWQRCGLRFEGLTASDHAAIAREVRRREMRAVRQGEDEEEAAGGSSGP